MVELLNIIPGFREWRKDRRRRMLRRQGFVAPERVEERPFGDMGDRELCLAYVDNTLQVRRASSAHGLSPIIDRGALMAEELDRRGLRDSVPTTEQFRRIEAELEARDA